MHIETVTCNQPFDALPVINLVHGESALSLLIHAVPLYKMFLSLFNIYEQLEYKRAHAFS